MSVTSSDAPRTARGNTTRISSRTVIEPTSGWRSLDLREVWRFRDLLRSLVVRDVKLRYRQTLLGVAWVVLQPLLSAAVLTFVFGRVARLPSEKVPYFLTALTGMVAWTLFSGVLQRGASSLIGNAALVGKVFFPRVLLPLSTVGSALLDAAVGLILIVALGELSGVGLHAQLLLAPIWLLLGLLVTLGPAMVFAALTVSYRDVAYVLPVALQAMLFISPVAYGISAVPARYRALYDLNPYVAPLQGFRASLLGQGLPPLSAIVSSGICGIVLLVVGTLYFRRHEQLFADVI